MSKKKTIPKSYKHPTDYLKEYGDWPNKWMIFSEDQKTGNEILSMFTSFIYFLIKNKFSVKTIKNHMLYLNLLGDEIIGRLNDEDEKNRTLPIKELILEYIEEEGGWHLASLY